MIANTTVERIRPNFIPERPKAIVQEMFIRPSVIGKIRLGIQVLTLKGQIDPKAVKIYEDGVSAGLSFSAIKKDIQEQCKIEYPMRPENIEYLKFNKSDFNDPESIDILLKKYGEDRGKGKMIYSLPVMFPYDDPLKVMPHRFSFWSASSLQYFSEYAEDGQRYCMKYSTPKKSEFSSRIAKSFSGRAKEIRQDEFIDGICDTDSCPQFQEDKCSLELSLTFLIPGLKGAGVVQAHSSSKISMSQWYATLKFVYESRGSLRGVNFSLTKKLMDITYVNKQGVTERSKQFITVLTSDIDIPDLLQKSMEGINEAVLVEEANSAAKVLHGKSKDIHVIEMSDEERDEKLKKLNNYLSRIDECNYDLVEKLRRKLAGYLKYLNVSNADFDTFARDAYGEEWSINEDRLKYFVNLLSQSTESEVKHLITR